MAIRPIVRYGDPVLAAPAKPVLEFDDALRTLVADMIQTMYAAPGVGLAATQIGVPLRLAVIDVSVGEKPGELMVLVNPEMTSTEGTQEVEEGCLSVPEFVEVVKRPARAEIRAFDLEGKEYTRQGEGLLARAFQHELDHLDGRLFLDRLPSITRSLLVRKVKKRARSEDW